MLQLYYMRREESYSLGYFTTMEGCQLPWSQYCNKKQHLLQCGGKNESNSSIYKWQVSPQLLGHELVKREKQQIRMFP